MPCSRGYSSSRRPVSRGRHKESSLDHRCGVQHGKSPRPWDCNYLQDSIMRSALRSMAASMRMTFCCSGVGSKKSGGIAREFYYSEIVFLMSQAGTFRYTDYKAG